MLRLFIIICTIPSCVLGFRVPSAFQQFGWRPHSSAKANKVANAQAEDGETSVKFLFHLEKRQHPQHGLASSAPRSQDEYLVVKEVPTDILSRYGNIPEILFVRDCYRDLYEVAAKSMLEELDKDVYRATLFTGVQGIGKSMFLMYFIYRFLSDDRFGDKRFALEFSRGEHACFRPTGREEGEFWCSYPRARAPDDLNSKQFLLLCDLSQTAEPELCAKRTFIFSSTDDRRYKEILKRPGRKLYTLPVWSQEELAAFNPNITSWWDNFCMFGGVPRHVFRTTNESKHMLADSLTSIGPTVATNFFQYGHPGMDSHQCDMLVHINPPVSNNGIVDYSGLQEDSFASDYIIRELSVLRRGAMLADTAEQFKEGLANGRLDPPLAGKLFKDFCLYIDPLSGKTLHCETLDEAIAKDSKVTVSEAQHVDGEGGKQQTRIGETSMSVEKEESAQFASEANAFRVPAKHEFLPHDWMERKSCVENVLYIPQMSDTRTGDAFYAVALPDGGHQLVVLQFSVGERHSVKAGSLHNIVQAFVSKVSESMLEKALVFVVPAAEIRLNSFREQARREGGDEPYADADEASLAALGFTQFVHRYALGRKRT